MPLPKSLSHRPLAASALAALMCFGGAVSSAAADSKDRPPLSAQQVVDLDRLTTPFFTSLKNGEVVAAYNDLFAGTMMIGKTVEIQQLVAQTTFILQTYGPVSEWEMFESECAAPNMCLAKYMIHAQQGPVFVWLYAYRRDGVWMPTNIAMGDTPSFAF